MSIERRRYIRLSTVFPVEFYVADKDGKRLTPWLQGFTRDIGKGGICILVNDLWWGFWDKIRVKASILHLEINLPFTKEPIIANAQVVWTKDKNGKEFKKYRIGVEFIGLPTAQREKLFFYALLHKLFPLILGAIAIVLAFYASVSFYRTQVLIHERRQLVSEYSNINQKSELLTKALGRENNTRDFLKTRKEALEKELKRLRKEVEIWEEKFNSVKNNQKLNEQVKKVQEDEIQKKVLDLENQIVFLRKENSLLKQRQQERHEVSQSLEEEVKKIEEKRVAVSKEIMQGMYEWIKNRQDLVKGLVLSYEGDSKLNKVCFTYDQALAVIVFLIFDDLKSAERTLDFYLKKINQDGKIYNAYYTSGDEFEAIYHSGPNAWIGIAALNYAKKTSNKKYLTIADKVSAILLSLMDKEGGIPGGPQEKWYSTEHNLDAYAFFKLFSEITGNRKYEDIANKIKAWLFKYAYTQYGSVVKRGKGDATIATDTYAWSITAIEPEVLLADQLNPDKIIEYAIDSCEVDAQFIRDKEKIIIRGFDFSKMRNRPGGYVVSGEWTAQMILALEIMANYYDSKDKAKSEYYFNRAVEYFNELEKMVISSPSKFGREDPCLPYASRADVDTGHGWRTPKGDKTGSLSSTAYCLISYIGYNPLTAQKLKISLRDREK